MIKITKNKWCIYKFPDTGTQLVFSPSNLIKCELQTLDILGFTVTMEVRYKSTFSIDINDKLWINNDTTTVSFQWDKFKVLKKKKDLESILRMVDIRSNLDANKRIKDFIEFKNKIFTHR